MMKMQKTALIVSLLMMTGMVAAAPSDVPRASQTPGDAFYFFDRFSESLELTVAQAPVIGSPELESKVRANHAAERLAEAQKLAEQNKSEDVDRLMEEYSEQVNLSVKGANKANNTELKQRLGNVSNNHVEVLRDVEKKVPEQAKKGIQNAIEKSQRNQRELGLPEPAQNRGKPDPNTGDRGKPTDQVPDAVENPDQAVNKTVGNVTENDRVEEIVNRTENLTSNNTEELEESVEESGDAVEDTVENSSEELDEETDQITGNAVEKPSASGLR